MDTSTTIKHKYCLVYIDILGFVKLPQEEARKSVLGPDDFREAYETEVERAIEKLELENSTHDSLDSWLLFAQNEWVAFRAIEEILKTRLEFEIAVGIGNFEEISMLNKGKGHYGKTISHLKSILELYKKWYERKIEKTFIVVTEELYNELDLLKIVCRKIVYRNKIFYAVNLNELKET